mmetsp:Transcript_7899/g.9210  ORF Transcript_7899/g.9210 Transcript_7899/m.9210 type:complete len:248 (+) Transcript_7899:1588-2331(+)
MLLIYSKPNLNSKEFPSSILKHKVNFARGLEGLRPYTKIVDLQQGKSLFHLEDGSINEQRLRGLFFIEYGMMCVEINLPNNTAHTRKKNSFRQKGFANSIYATPYLNDSNLSIGKLQARSLTICEESALLKSVRIPRNERSGNVRLARFGPGWIIGIVEGCFELPDPGTHTAITDCRLHYLPFEKIDELEITNPRLVLKLFKLTSLLLARKQEGTIYHLATLHSVMTSPSPSKPIERTTMSAIKNLL